MNMPARKGIGLAAAIALMTAACPIAAGEPSPSFHLRLSWLAGRDDGGTGLWEIDQAQEELGLTEPQRAELAEARRERDEALRRPRPSADARGRAEWRARWAEARRRRAEAVAAYRKRVDQILRPEQRERFRQIRLQWAVPEVLGEQEVVLQLGITAEQAERLRAIGQQWRAKLRGLAGRRTAPTGQPPPASSWTDDEIREEVERLRREAIEQALGVLSPEQHQKLGQMQGPAFPSQHRPAAAPSNAAGPDGSNGPTGP